MRKIMKISYPEYEAVGPEIDELRAMATAAIMKVAADPVEQEWLRIGENTALLMAEAIRYGHK